MDAPRRGSTLGETSAGPHRIAYLERGPTDAPAVICVHGLTGCARDFDALAPALADAGYRVVCPDVAGRGDSDRLADPRGYHLRQYVADMTVLLAHLEVDTVDWVGISMGGMIGMALAAREDSPVRRLVLNDIGPFIPVAALQRLDSYVGADPVFTDLAAAEAHLRRTREPFGDLTDTQWREMAERSTRPTTGGSLRLHHDPAIAVRFHETADRDIDMWSTWDEVECPVLVLRGEHSDLLLADTAEEMRHRGPRALVHEFEGCGHNPPLLEPDQIAVVVEWLRGH